MEGFTPLNLFGENKEETKTITNEEVVSENCDEKELEVANEDVKESCTSEASSDENVECFEAEEPVVEEAVVEEPVAEESVAEAPVTEESVAEESVAEESVAEESVAEEVVVENQVDKIEEVLSNQQQILERMDNLNKLFSTRIMHSDYEEKVIDQMHKELQKYKEDMYAQLVRPILLDIIEVRDSILRIAANYLAKPEGEQNIPNKMFADYSFDLQDILEKNNVEIYRSKQGDSFEPAKQRIIKKIPTEDKTLHGIVAESLSCGYSYNGRVISVEKIAAYYFEA